MKKRSWKQRLSVFAIMVLVFGCLGFFGFTFFMGEAKPAAVQKDSGMNIKLPETEKQPELSKLEQYMQQEQDSVKRSEERKLDPYAKGIVSANNITTIASSVPELKEVKPKAAKPYNPVYSFVREEQESTFKPAVVPVIAKDTTPRQYQPDPELQHLSSMLDKLALLQQPKTMVTDKSETVNKDAVAISPFFEGQLLLAVVHGQQVILNGAIIRLRLLKSIHAGNHTIPKGHFIYGQCTIASERVQVQITSLTYNAVVIPVALTVYDLDGMEGINVPGAVTGEVLKEEGNRALQSFNLNSMSAAGIAGQAAGAGIEAARSLFSSKLRQHPVKVKSGHQVLLQNQKQ